LINSNINQLNEKNQALPDSGIKKILSLKAANYSRFQGLTINIYLLFFFFATFLFLATFFFFLAITFHPLSYELIS